MLFARSLSSVRPKSVVFNSSNTKTASLTTTYSFNYGGNLSAGQFVVVVLTGRSVVATTGTWTALSDDAGNTYTEAIDATQTNNLTYTAIYYTFLKNNVTSSNVLSATTDYATPANAQHSTILLLNNINALANTRSNPLASVSSLPNSAATDASTGIAIHAISTGLAAAPTVTTVSTGFVSQTSLRVGGCSQYVATGIYSTRPGGTVSNTFAMSAISGNYANVFAVFK